VQRTFVVSEAFYGGIGSGSDVFDSPATVMLVQATLRDLGYYNGRIDGRLNAVTRSAIGMFQRDQRLRQTGFLDRSTLDRLGLISQGGGEVSAVNVISANAAIRPGNQLNIRIVTQGTSGLELFEDHFRQRDAIHVYVRGFRNAGFRSTSELNITLRPEEWQGVDRIVVHGTGNDIVIRSTDLRAGNAITAAQAAALEARITNLLQQYATALGVRYNRVTGQIEFSQRINYRENETELLFALNSAASTARLYTQLLRTSDDPQAIAGATDIFVAQTNAVERAISRTKSGRATNVTAGWRALQDDLRRLDDASTRNFQDRPGYQ
jgi:peptidoglycan hydrolase-like protein with peptidoglycan-binding domain